MWIRSGAADIQQLSIIRPADALPRSFALAIHLLVTSGCRYSSKRSFGMTPIRRWRSIRALSGYAKFNANHSSSRVGFPSASARARLQEYLPIPRSREPSVWHAWRSTSTRLIGFSDHPADGALRRPPNQSKVARPNSCVMRSLARQLPLLLASALLWLAPARHLFQRRRMRLDRQPMSTRATRLTVCAA